MSGRSQLADKVKLYIRNGMKVDPSWGLATQGKIHMIVKNVDLPLSEKKVNDCWVTKEEFEENDTQYHVFFKKKKGDLVWECIDQKDLDEDHWADIHQPSEKDKGAGGVEAIFRELKKKRLHLTNAIARGGKVGLINVKLSSCNCLKCGPKKEKKEKMESKKRKRIEMKQHMDEMTKDRDKYKKQYEDTDEELKREKKRRRTAALEAPTKSQHREVNVYTDKEKNPSSLIGVGIVIEQVGDVVKVVMKDLQNKSKSNEYVYFRKLAAGNYRMVLETTIDYVDFL